MARDDAGTSACPDSGASRPDHASKRENATATHRTLTGNASALLRGCAMLTPRYGDIANADVVQPHVHMPPDVGTTITVSNNKTPPPPTVPSPATLPRCFAGALCLRRATFSTASYAPVARRNDRARATSDGGTREGGASRPDYATKRENATAAHRALTGNASALLRGCAPLTPRYGVYCFLYLGVDGLAF